MGTFLFRWGAPATDVIVTGTFDNWAKNIHLTRDRSMFSKLVELPDADKSYEYKFLIDGKWKLDPSAPVEEDGQGNTNNVLKPEHITKIPGKDQSYGVAPIPATPGAGNPVQLAPGEKVPNSKEVTANTVESAVRTDKASYERGASAVPGPHPAPGRHLVIQSSGPYSSTAALAGQVPKESPFIESGGPFSSPAAAAAAASATQKESTPQHIVIQSSGPYSSSAAKAADVPKEASSLSDNKGAIAGAAAGGAAAVAAGAAVTYAATSSDKSSAPAASSSDKPAAEPVTYAAPSSDKSPAATAADAAAAKSPPSAAAGSTTAAGDTSKASNDSKVSTGALAAGGAVAVGAAATAGAVAYATHSDPSEPKIADEDTMPAIAVANRTADPPSTTVTSSGETIMRDPNAKSPTQQGPVAAFQSDPIGAPGAPDASATASSTEDPRKAAPAFRSDPISADGALAPVGIAPTQQGPVEAFHDDPIGAPGAPDASGTAVASSDPRKVSSAFASDPISAPGAIAEVTPSSPTQTTNHAAAAAEAPQTPNKPIDNKPFSAASRGGRDVSPTPQKPSGEGVDRMDMATPTKSSQSTPNSTPGKSSAAKSKKRRSFMKKVKDSFLPRPGRTGADVDET